MKQCLFNTNIALRSHYCFTNAFSVQSLNMTEVTLRGSHQFRLYPRSWNVSKSKHTFDLCLDFWMKTVAIYAVSYWVFFKKILWVEKPVINMPQTKLTFELWYCRYRNCTVIVWRSVINLRVWLHVSRPLWWHFANGSVLAIFFVLFLVMSKWASTIYVWACYVDVSQTLIMVVVFFWFFLFVCFLSSRDLCFTIRKWFALKPSSYNKLVHLVLILGNQDAICSKIQFPK